MKDQLHASDADSAYQSTQRITVIGAILDLSLGLLKLIVGWVGHSQALVADGFHSLSDLATDALVFWANKHGNRKADSDHPYGHERFKTAATVFLGIALIMVATGILIDAGLRLLEQNTVTKPTAPTLMVAFVSILSKEIIYHLTLRVANRYNSNLLRANAWHSRSDALSSVVVFIGIAGAMMGFVFLDTLAAIIVATMVAHIGWSLAWDGLRELVDTGLDEKRLAQLETKMLEVDGVKSAHQLRSRRMGDKFFADVHVHVSPYISVSEGHRIADAVSANLLSNIKELDDVIVHIDPEDDDTTAPSSHLPLRNDIISVLQDAWQDAASVQPTRIVLHYVRGSIDIELWLQLSEFNELQEAQTAARDLVTASRKITHVGSVKVVLVV